MSARMQIETRVRRLIVYLDDIKNGMIQIPAFQRDFIWKAKDKLDLFDSIKLGYPIGSVLLWKPQNESFDRIEKFGPFDVKAPVNSDYFYVLDGFQRLSTLFGCLTNPDNMMCDRQEWEKDFRIYYDLSKDEFFIPRSDSFEVYQVPIYSLIDTKMTFALQNKLERSGLQSNDIDRYMERYVELGSRLIDFQLPSIDIKGGDISEAVEIFSRVNSKGADISPDWMISALTYNRDDRFRLGTLIDSLIAELRKYNFQNIKRELVLQCIINSFGKPYFDQSNKIEELAKRIDFIDVARNTIESIKKAVKFLYEQLLVVDVKLLPYNNQLIFITDFFNSVETPNAEQFKELKRWFWITTYTNYFTIYSLSKQREAYWHFHRFIDGDVMDSVYNDKPGIRLTTVDFPNKIYFGSVRAKALVLFLLNYANRFNTLNSESYHSFDLLYLFYDIKDSKHNYFPESILPVILGEPRFDEVAKYVNHKDASSLLLESKKLDNFIVSDYIKSKFNETKVDSVKSDILKCRKQDIQEQELRFVEELNVQYVS